MLISDEPDRWLSCFLLSGHRLDVALQTFHPSRLERLGRLNVTLHPLDPSPPMPCLAATAVEMDTTAMDTLTLSTSRPPVASYMTPPATQCLQQVITPAIHTHFTSLGVVSIAVNRVWVQRILLLVDGESSDVSPEEVSA